MVAAIEIKKASPRQIAPLPAILGQAANQAAAGAAFGDYERRKATNTRRRMARDLVNFCEFLEVAGQVVDYRPGDLGAEPEAWAGITWGLVAAYKNWLLQQGYSIGTVNLRLTTIKVYAGLAVQAGTMSVDELAKIRLVHGYSWRESRRVDAQRQADGLETRAGVKKAESVHLEPDQAHQLKDQGDSSPQARRDGLLMCLLLDHGLRCGEVAGLRVENVNLVRAELRFFRPKVDREQVHRLSKDALAAARVYLALDQRAAKGPLLLGSRRNGSLAGKMGERAIAARVELLGNQVGAVGLSPHDCRHYWATQAALHGSSLERLRDAGGWSSLAMPSRYIEASAIANQGVLLE